MVNNNTGFTNNSMASRAPSYNPQSNMTSHGTQAGSHNSTFGMNHGKQQNNPHAHLRNRIAERGNNQPRPVREYPIHNKVQLMVNMLQKLHANRSDMATNTKNMDFSDSDFRMLPLKSAAMGAPYAFSYKIFSLFYVLLSIPALMFNIQIYYLIGIAGLVFLFAYGFPVFILRNAKQYISGNKTKKFYKRMIAGWQLFEVMIYMSFFTFAAIYIFKDTQIVQGVTYYLSSFSFSQRIGLSQIFLNTHISALFYSFASFFALFLMSAFIGNATGNKAQKENMKAIQIETGREEVADKLLDGDYE